jgi:Txe/YoeB family toxin of Txe-Axe toxin-antitoxin module
MEPQSPQANSSPEMGAYRTSEAPANSGEVKSSMPEASKGSAETREVAPQSAGAPASVPVLPAMPSLPLPQSQTNSKPVQSAQDDSPLVATDEDVIEKEWVDKAKKIVAQTKTDPYTQEKEVSKLQADYIKKRYGKEIKLISEQ